jgi:NAD-dependent SIR2 family protein deacetylase
MNNPPDAPLAPPAPLVARAARALREAGALLVTAGAGMGVDSGLPDFRGNQGFWKAYPPYERLGLGFSQMANPRWFRERPELAWGFYGHRLNLYRATIPHAGFARLKAWGEALPGGTFVFTSNVDGQFQKAGFDPEAIVECHGSIHHLQCLEGCGSGIFSASGVEIHVDQETMKATGPLPTCPQCGGLARPNILMFGDGMWDHQRTSEQERRLQAWVDRIQQEKRPLVVVECGAGTGIPTVRMFGERVSGQLPGATLVRLNVREPEVDAGQIGIPCGALAGLEAIEQALRAR